MEQNIDGRGKCGKIEVRIYQFKRSFDCEESTRILKCSLLLGFKFCSGFEVIYKYCIYWEGRLRTSNDAFKV
jgi:hypothetical protein